VAEPPLDAGGNAPPVLSALNVGQPGGEEAAERLRVATAQPDGARARREVRLEVGRRWRERRRRRGEVVRPREDVGGG
jgi:hypothetical protein